MGIVNPVLGQRHSLLRSFLVLLRYDNTTP